MDTLKTCFTCKVPRPLNDFHRNAPAKDGHKGSCKTCVNRQKREWIRRTHYRSSNPHRQSHLKKNFNIGEDEYLHLLSLQRDGCAICGQIETARSNQGDGCVRSLSVDHDRTCCSGPRSCGQCVRGLLCSRCNIGLGHFRDDPEVLRRAAIYASCPHRPVAGHIEPTSKENK